MTVYKYPYTRVTRASATSPLLRFKNQPLLDVGLLNQSKQLIKVKTYIDTGAQWCLFSNQYAKPLGIKDYKDTKECFSLSGIGGQNANMAYFHDLTLVVFKDTKKLKLDNAIEIQTKIGFVEKEFGFGGILGVYGFLDHFVFIGNIPKGYFELQYLF